VRKTRRRRCLNCQQLFCGDPRTRTQQKYCPEPACRAASKCASQKRWLLKAENRDYFSGPQHVNRVQAWRNAKAGDGRERSLKRQPLQETILLQVLERHKKSTPLALQETMPAQVPDAVEKSGALVGFALQDSM
jgi:hypothetical protein